LYITVGTISGLPRDASGGVIAWENAMLRKHLKFQSENIPADLYLGTVIAGVSALIGIALIIVFA